jgi:hypothetical protein
MAKMTARESVARDSRALDLRRAGVPVPRIMEELRFTKLSTVEDAIRRAIKLQGVQVDPLQVRDLELDRLDRLQQGLWLKAAKGDLAAVDRVLRLSEMRIKLAGVPDASTAMRDAFAATVAALALTAADSSLVAAGARIAEKIDAAGASGDSQAETKALYLVPHLMNVLRELGATPAAREALGEVVSAGGNASKNEFDEFKLRKGTA